jgi:hypothetical protein
VESTETGSVVMIWIPPCSKQIMSSHIRDIHRRIVLLSPQIPIQVMWNGKNIVYVVWNHHIDSQV